jgi:putative nucleotidyltransferase with HDIG domain
VPYVEQKVSIGNLKLGMYVSRLDRPWVETRYLFQGFFISDVSDIQELREYCEYVYVDPERGEPVPEELQINDSENGKDGFAEVFRNVPVNDTYPVVTSVEEEIGACRESREHILDIVTSILDDLKAGRTIKMRTVRQSVNKMIASIIRNPDAFFWLTRLKSKDSYAYAHCVDACGLAVAFGRHLGFSRPDLEDLAVGCLLFDIGKLQLPEGLLKKPGRLTENEYGLIRRHVEFGVELVRKMKGTSKEIVSIVLHHHERHNGTGYPRGVPGPRIPVKGRIASLVDCYDAITSERTYSSAVSPYEAIREIYEWRGKDFQADMVEQFIQCIGLFPTGTLVELNTGQVGLVLAQNRVRRLRPKILLVLDKDKFAYGFNPVLDLIQDPRDENGELVEIRRPLEPGTYGINARDFYL